MRYLSIKNYAKHQHYKNRRPPWIKLHVEVLDDYAFACLQDASKAHLMLLWVLASKLDNRIPYDLPFLTQKLGATGPVDVEELVLQGFIEVSADDSKPLASRKQVAIAEREREAESEKESAGALPRVVRVVRPSKAIPAYATEGAGYWERSVGAMKPATFDKTMSPIVALHGWPAVFTDLKRWVSERQVARKQAVLKWYAETASARLSAPPPPPIVDEFGALTPYGERITRPDKVPA